MDEQAHIEPIRKQERHKKWCLLNMKSWHTESILLRNHKWLQVN